MAVTGKAEGERGTVLVGVALLVCGAWIAAVGDAIAKYVGADVPVLQIVWARYAFALVPLVPFLVFHMGPREVARHFGALELLRGVALVAVTGFYFSAIQLMPLADALALLFLYPLIATGLAAIFLGERVRRLVLVLSVVAFAGVLLVVRPGFGAFNSGAVLAALAAVSVATNMVVNRGLAGRTPAFAGMVYATLIGFVISSAAVPFVWVWPSPTAWALLAALGVLSSLVTWLIYSAFGYGPAGVIAPFGYSEIIAAAILGLVVFGEFPDALAVAGIALIVASGVLLAARGSA
jgi:drug/metabolite transporter (DMT)-like permease